MEPNDAMSYLNTAYDLAIMWSEDKYYRLDIPNNLKKYIANCTQNVLNVDHKIRKRVPNLNKKLTKIISFGFLDLTEKEFKKLDNQTKKLYLEYYEKSEKTFLRNYQKNRDAVHRVNEVMRPTNVAIKVPGFY